MSVPLIEQGSGVGSSSSDATVQTTTATAAETVAAGPSVAFSFSDGSTVVLSREDLQVYLLAIQTLLLLYVTYREVTN